MTPASQFFIATNALQSDLFALHFGWNLFISYRANKYGKPKKTPCHIPVIKRNYPAHMNTQCCGF